MAVRLRYRVQNGVKFEKTAHLRIAKRAMLASASSQAQWKTPVEMWREQIEAFAKLYPHDVRAVQPLNGRMVKESR